jgi:hypothetical protein
MEEKLLLKNLVEIRKNMEILRQGMQLILDGMYGEEEGEETDGKFSMEKSIQDVKKEDEEEELEPPYPILKYLGYLG